MSGKCLPLSDKTLLCQTNTKCCQTKRLTSDRSCMTRQSVCLTSTDTIAALKPNNSDFSSCKYLPLPDKTLLCQTNTTFCQIAIVSDVRPGPPDKVVDMPDINRGYSDTEAQ